MGLWLVLFLMEHLLVNSQAALLIGDDGNGFVRAVNSIKELPYLPFIEAFLLGVPFMIHGIWGIQYLLTGRINSFKTDGSTPSLPQYPLNRAYTWQRITSWILLFGILAHVIHMRFVEYPLSASVGADQMYMVPLNLDTGLYTLSKRLNFVLYDSTKIKGMALPLIPNKVKDDPEALVQAQSAQQQANWIETMRSVKLKEGQVLAVSKSFGVAELLMVRDTFKNPLMILLYSALVLAASYHGFHGLWMAMITWGIAMTEASQRLIRKIAVFFMVLIAFFGLAAIWGTYWINLWN